MQQLTAWVSGIPGYAGAEPRPASNDASFRRYFRVDCGEGTAIVMDAPPPREDCRPFVQVAAYLEKIGLNAPRILAADLEQGFLLLTDLGSTDYLSALKNDPETADTLYADALRALATLHRDGSGYQAQLPPYDAGLLLQEMNIFREWLWERHLGLAFDEGELRLWNRTCELLVNNALQQQRVFVHRDYHSRNLMLRDSDNPGILDFQDALEGPFTYDLVSLLKDCYIRWPAEWIEARALQFYDGLSDEVKDSTASAAFLRQFDLMGVQRHLKASGIFARLRHRDGKTDYMGDIPRTLNYIVDIAPRYPELAFLDRLIRERCLPALESEHAS